VSAAKYGIERVDRAIDTVVAFGLTAGVTAVPADDVAVIALLAVADVFHGISAPWQRAIRAAGVGSGVGVVDARVASLAQFEDLIPAFKEISKVLGKLLAKKAPDQRSRSRKSGVIERGSSGCSIVRRFVNRLSLGYVVSHLV
jgi:hypothetical protein